MTDARAAERARLVRAVRRTVDAYLSACTIRTDGRIIKHDEATYRANVMAREALARFDAAERERVCHAVGVGS